ncbi:type I-F CRISPR-associated helicase Cas3f [Aliikangiella maris]|uniref:Type I-F CRISPR-associated helicase Cas3f n=2 Tax=Aliikangiella maris TaxID=3162458 RepID=A0ABV3MNL8_9GAMM
MMVTFVSQCEKNALKKTRRVLDAFANRIGDNVWQTVITQEGLNAVRKLLKRTASRSTAVSCHWIRSRARSELVWVVGNRNKFNAEGVVPVNSTRRNFLNNPKSQWNTAEDITLLAAIAALFHDFGKANQLFQNKIDPDKKSKLSEPFRHEWISLIIFCAFVGDLNDEAWLKKLSEIQTSEDKKIKDKIKQSTYLKVHSYCPLQDLPPLAKTIGWLILTHHKLPQRKVKPGESGLRAKFIEGLLNKHVSALWNSPQIDKEWKSAELKEVWSFPKGTAFKSSLWCYRARSVAKRALKRACFFQQNNWLYDKYTLHVARMSLMLADHYYSSLPANEALTDQKYKAYANSDRKTKVLKQKLDEHLVGVYQNTLKLVRALPALKDELPAITKLQLLKKRTSIKRFQWQDKAYDIARALQESSEKCGFFGVNMASTGKGKTFANVRIMYALTKPEDGWRLSIALGLRTLTLQTGDALKERLMLSEEDIAVLIGSQTVKQLHERNNSEQDNNERDEEKVPGSESADELTDETQHIFYDGAISDSPLKNWLEKQPKLNQLINAPILVSTIDHLMPATESARGGRQIAPMLRLMTSDLVLDEPDDFDIADLPALTRLVNWAGLLGSKVLLSSATLPPAIVSALFDAYREGREHYHKARGEQSAQPPISCAWFDEYRSVSEQCYDLESFQQQQTVFADKRVQELNKKTPIHKAVIASVNTCEQKAEVAIEVLSETIRDNIYQLHQKHYISATEFNKKECYKKISIGLVRMANINPLVAVAKNLMSSPVNENYHLHFCIYHSQHPLIVRSEMEKQLDKVLTRNDETAIWKQPIIQQSLKKSEATHHIFIVIASAVAEVGRDHDYDWAIAEPSSMRSIIQLAGRIQRHRQKPAETENLILLDTNYKGLMNKKLAFSQPGFESGEFQLNNHSLNAILDKSQYDVISSIPRIKPNNPLNIHDNLVDLEHGHLQAALFDKAARIGAHNWWRSPASWTYELQRETPFRRSIPDSEYFLRADDSGSETEFYRWHRNGEYKSAQAQFKAVEVELNNGISIWGDYQVQELLENMAEQNGESLLSTSIKFGAIRLRDSEKTWLYSSTCGVYQAL